MDESKDIVQNLSWEEELMVHEDRKKD